MKTKDFNKLIKKEDCKKIINMYVESKIYLTDKQLEKIIQLKNK